MATFQRLRLYLAAAATVLAAAREPIYQDWLNVEAKVVAEIEASHCDEHHPKWKSDVPDHTGKMGECKCNLRCTCFPVFRNPRPLGSRLIRLAFHDAAGEMDAYVDMGKDENDGLDCATNILDDAYDDFMSDNSDLVLSKADFYAWAYIAAVRYGADRRTVKGGADVALYPEIPITVGRVTYDPAGPTPAPAEAFPDKGGLSNYDEIMDYFNINFGYTVAEVTALMGAHTLGGGRIDTSGFTGMWTQSKNQLDEAYYVNMDDPDPVHSCNDGFCTTVAPSECTDDNKCKGWQQVKMGGPSSDAKFQWRHSCSETSDGGVDTQTCHHLMLNSDMALLYDFDGCTDANNNPMSCIGANGEIMGYPGGFTTGQCSEAKFNKGHKLIKCFSKRDAAGPDTAAGLARDFADIEVWIEAFGPIFDKLIRRPYNDLSILVAPSTTDTSTTTETTITTTETTNTLSENAGPCNFPSDCKSGCCHEGAGGQKNCRPESFC